MLKLNLQNRSLPYHLRAATAGLCISRESARIHREDIYMFNYFHQFSYTYTRHTNLYRESNRKYRMKSQQRFVFENFIKDSVFHGPAHFYFLNNIKWIEQARHPGTISYIIFLKKKKYISLMEAEGYKCNLILFYLLYHRRILELMDFPGHKLFLLSE